jgi:alpha-beta hydrolase superfamily lysophospholipase
VVQIETCYYSGGRHEMLNETNRDEVTKDIVTWLGRTLER